MKKLFLITVCAFLLTGCGNVNELSNEEIISNSNDIVEESEELKDPIIEWCQIYNPNGYNTVTCVISNPNDVDIDISYDLVFYKDGNEVSRTDEQWSNFQISKKHSDVIWGNSNIPSPEDADDVKLENIIVTEAYNSSVEAEIKYLETIEDKAYFTVKSNIKPTLNTIWILEYNDENKNDSCDKGELLAVDIIPVMEKETKISIDTDVYNATSYEVYYNAY